MILFHSTWTSSLQRKRKESVLFLLREYRQYKCVRDGLQKYYFTSNVDNEKNTRLFLFEPLHRLLPQDVSISYNRYDRERHGRGESYHPVHSPDVVITPKTLQDVQTIVQFCFQHRIPLIPFGAGTSVEGHVSALHGGISLDMSLFQSIHLPPTFINNDESYRSDDDDDNGNNSTFPDLHAVVGAGVTRQTLNRALRHHGLMFSVDPGADATIGGMVATGASGTTTIKYGGMRENILQLEVVMANADAIVVQCGTHALKNSAGYDLLGLFCGSEGTLGVITRATVKLHPIPDHLVSATCQFDSLWQAAQYVSALRLTSAGHLSRCELLDTASVHALNAYNNNSNPQNLYSTATSGKDQRWMMDARPTLFLEFQGLQSSMPELIDNASELCREHSGSAWVLATTEEDRNRLWNARHNLYYAAIAVRPGATGAIVTDCCVPLSQFASLMDATSRHVHDLGVMGPCFGHAGDGNLHCILPVRDDDDEAYLRKLQVVQSNLMDRTIAAGGTVTGEHGVGYGKIPHLEHQYGSGAVSVMRSIKVALDPMNIMNPGKVIQLPSSFSSSSTSSNSRMT